MTKVLVIGGTRFFGVHLVKALLKRGMDVTIATRGTTHDSFGDKVNRVTVDRTNFKSFKEAFKGTQWDMVFDQICYSSKDATEAIEVFRGKTPRYILTSTMSVYDIADKELKEDDYNPFHYNIEIKDRNEASYQEGKRQAEAVFFQRAPFSVAAVRFPIVLGMNDYTDRLNFHIKKVLKDEGIYFSNVDSNFGYISETEAGEFLAWIGTSKYEGPINTCADGTITLKQLMALIEEHTGKNFILADKKEGQNESPYNIPSSWYMSNERARELGFTFSRLQEWLPKLIATLVEQQREQLKC